MPKLTIEIRIAEAPLHGPTALNQPDLDVAEILRKLAVRIKRDGIQDTYLYHDDLHDVNGRKCGHLVLEG